MLLDLDTPRCDISIGRCSPPGQGSGYYLAGAAYLGFSALLYVIDTAASDKVDAVTRAARQAYELASQPSFYDPR